MTYQIVHAAGRRRSRVASEPGRDALSRARLPLQKDTHEPNASDRDLPGGRRPHHGRVAVPTASSSRASRATGTRRAAEALGAHRPRRLRGGDQRHPPAGPGRRRDVRSACAQRHATCRRSSSSPATARSTARSQLLKLGAADYITKPFDLEQLIEKVRGLWRARRAPRRRAERGTRSACRRRCAASRRCCRGSPGTPSTVLITGESGVGKERVAQQLHRPGRAAPSEPVRRGELRRHHRER
ncbi:MAG: sigma 54-interacting transcriptional regulator [Comamonadaceae bacterium]|nr:sigma 54-interacting transcriptional regulator [Comamonadaceae bacterium]